jgi:hypothetical protein
VSSSPCSRPVSSGVERGGTCLLRDVLAAIESLVTRFCGRGLDVVSHCAHALVLHTHRGKEKAC